MKSYDKDGLRFLNKLSGKLDVRLAEAPSASTREVNGVASPGAALEDVSFHLQVFEKARFRELTEAELGRVVVRSPHLKLRGESKTVVEHTAPDGVAFTVRDLASAIEATERAGRGASQWHGSIDVRHVHFEGIHLDAGGVWAIHWGA